MTRRLIDAGEALQDIRSGMSDLALMKKYNLSQKGLQSLFRKLGDAGIIKHINARSLVKDLRSGMTDRELMEKYELSPTGFRKLLEEMERVGIIDVVSEPEPERKKVVIPIEQLVKDIRSGMSREEILEKYRLTSRGLRWASMMLVSSGAIGWKELLGGVCSSFDEIVPETVRDAKRYTLDFEAPVYVVNRPDLCGTVRDLSQGGLSVRGIRAQVGETQTLVVKGDEFGEYASFAFEATCKWTGKEPSGDFISGYEISNISVGSLGEFQLLVRLVQLQAHTNGGIQ